MLPSTAHTASCRSVFQALLRESLQMKNDDQPEPRNLPFNPHTEVESDLEHSRLLTVSLCLSLWINIRWLDWELAYLSCAEILILWKFRLSKLQLWIRRQQFGFERGCILYLCAYALLCTSLSGIICKCVSVGDTVGSFLPCLERSCSNAAVPCFFSVFLAVADWAGYHSSLASGWPHSQDACITSGSLQRHTGEPSELWAELQLLVDEQHVVKQPPRLF